MGSEDCVKEVKIGALLEESVKKGLIKLLREYVDVFAWSYEDMPGLDTDIVQHPAFEAWVRACEAKAQKNSSGHGSKDQRGILEANWCGVSGDFYKSSMGGQYYAYA